MEHYYSLGQEITVWGFGTPLEKQVSVKRKCLEIWWELFCSLGIFIKVSSWQGTALGGTNIFFKGWGVSEGGFRLR